MEEGESCKNKVLIIARLCQPSERVDKDEREEEKRGERKERRGREKGREEGEEITARAAANCLLSRSTRAQENHIQD